MTPVKSLPAAVTVALVFPLHRTSASWADREPGQAGNTVITMNLRYSQRLPIGKLSLYGGGNEQIIWCHVKAGTKLFKGDNGWRGLASGDGPEVAGADGAPFRAAFVAEVIKAAKLEKIGGKIV